jgi:hypothetical protein
MIKTHFKTGEKVHVCISFNIEELRGLVKGRPIVGHANDGSLRIILLAETKIDVRADLLRFGFISPCLETESWEVR